MNIEQARFNMIEQQIRPWDVLNQGVLERACSMFMSVTMEKRRVRFYLARAGSTLTATGFFDAKRRFAQAARSSR